MKYDEDESLKHGDPGKARATQEVNLSFRVPGRLVTFPVKVGDIVTEREIGGPEQVTRFVVAPRSPEWGAPDDDAR